MSKLNDLENAAQAALEGKKAQATSWIIVHADKILIGGAIVIALAIGASLISLLF